MAMKQRGCLFFIALLLAWSSPGHCQEPCKSFAQPYQARVLPQLKGGIPFELVVLGQRDQEMICRKSLNLHFDLWDEVIHIKLNGEPRPDIKLADGLAELCKYLQCESASGRNYTIRVLLNPLWEGQLKKVFRVREKDGGYRFYKIDWVDLSEGLPKDVEIFRQEVLLD